MDVSHRNTYANNTAFQSDVNGLKSTFLSKIQPVQNSYDADTNHGTIQTQQDRWNNLINTAFTQLRVPPATAADGTPLKTSLLDVLRGAGIVL